VTGYWSDGTSAPLPGATLSSSGGSVSGNSISWSTPGSKSITANCGNGLSATASADVQQLNIVVHDSAYFNVDKTVIYRTDDQSRLRAIAQVLKDHPDIKLVIDGHTDSDGSVAYNARLGMNRAAAMKAFLAKEGVAVDRMTITLRTFGECNPVAPNNTADGRSLNRRAELHEFGNTPPAEASASCKEAGRERNP
ncbi:MAG TPA: OmpA family protein, partial [Gemmatimonadales bacterium]|nr:OmpA family protein [Gemmatimonadales bacterium]